MRKIILVVLLVFFAFFVGRNSVIKDSVKHSSKPKQNNITMTIDSSEDLNYCIKGYNELVDQANAQIQKLKQEIEEINNKLQISEDNYYKKEEVSSENNN